MILDGAFRSCGFSLFLSFVSLGFGMGNGPGYYVYEYCMWARHCIGHVDGTVMVIDTQDIFPLLSHSMSFILFLLLRVVLGL